jgi:hypothetical protein
MKHKTIPQTFNTPGVKLDEEQRALNIEGKSTPNDPVEFYSHLLEWIKELEKSTVGLQEINMKLTYMNTGSSKWIFHIFKEVEGIHGQKGKLVINWYYEEDDESMHDIGEDYRALLKLKVNLIPQAASDN